MYSSLDDVEILLRPTLGRALTVDEAGKVMLLLQHAAGKLRQQVPQLDQRLAAGTLDPTAVAAVSTAMVHRVMLNPDGRRTASESIDDFSRSWTVDAALSTGALYVSDDELAGLAPAPAHLRVGTIRVGHAL